MMTGETALTLRQALKMFYPAGAGIATIHRHVTKGVRTPCGVVKLEAERLGGRWTTTPEAVRRFRERCTRAAGGQPPPSPAREARKAAAKAHLESLGL
jgi:hypothetical protein